MGMDGSGAGCRCRAAIKSNSLLSPLFHSPQVEESTSNDGARILHGVLWVPGMDTQRLVLSENGGRYSASPCKGCGTHFSDQNTQVLSLCLDVFFNNNVLKLFYYIILL